MFVYIFISLYQEWYSSSSSSSSVYRVYSSLSVILQRWDLIDRCLTLPHMCACPKTGFVMSDVIVLFVFNDVRYLFMVDIFSSTYILVSMNKSRFFLIISN
jgi:hypothetical protein